MKRHSLIEQKAKRWTLSIAAAAVAAGLSSTASATMLFTGDYAPQHWTTQFTASNPSLLLNSQTISPASGDTATALFSWDASTGIYPDYNGAGNATFLFSTTATGNDTLAFHWVDSAFAAYYESYQNARAFYNDAAGTHWLPLGWNTSGDAMMTVASGYTFGFSIQTGNFDYNTHLYGSLSVSSVVPEPSTYLAGALLLLPFGLQGMRHLRRREA